MKIRWPALTVITLLAICIGPGCVSPSRTLSSMTFFTIKASDGESNAQTAVKVTAKPASGSSTGATNTPQTIPVRLTVAEAPPDTSVISLNSVSFSFSGTQGEANPSIQMLTVSNPGAGNLSWSLSKTAAWLTLSKASGTNAGTSTLSVNITGLNPGIYGDNITITASGATNSPVKVPIVLTISAAAPPPLNPVVLNSAGGHRHCRCGH